MIKNNIERRWTEFLGRTKECVETMMAGSIDRNLLSTEDIVGLIAMLNNVLVKKL